MGLPKLDFMGLQTIFILVTLTQKQTEPFSKQEKEYVKAVYCHPAYLTFMQSTSYIMRNAGLEEAQAGIKIAGRNFNNLRYADDITLWQTVKRNSKAS